MRTARPAADAVAAVFAEVAHAPVAVVVHDVVLAAIAQLGATVGAARRAVTGGGDN